jgi:hypothetical protein
MMAGLLATAQTTPPQQRQSQPAVQSQQPGTGWYTINDSLSKKWAMTEEQRTKIKEIDARYDKMRNDPNNAQRTNTDGMLDRRDQEYMKVLNTSQYEQWQAYGKHMRTMNPGTTKPNNTQSPGQNNLENQQQKNVKP